MGDGDHSTAVIAIANTNATEDAIVEQPLAVAA